MRILLDHNVPHGLKPLIPGHDVRTAADEGWSELSNGELLAAAEAFGFECLVTADKNIEYQQNVAARRIGLVVLSTNAWPVLKMNLGAISAAIGGASAGSYFEVLLPRPALVRRGRPPGL